MIDTNFSSNWVREHGGDFFSFLNKTFENSFLLNWINASVVQPATNFWENPSAFVSNTTSDTSSFLSNWVNTSVIQPATNFWESRSVCILNNEIHLDDPSTVSKILFGLGTILVSTGLALACIGCHQKRAANAANRETLPITIPSSLAICSPNAIHIMEANAQYAVKLSQIADALYPSEDERFTTDQLQSRFLQQDTEEGYSIFKSLRYQLNTTSLSHANNIARKTLKDSLSESSEFTDLIETIHHNCEKTHISARPQTLVYSEYYTTDFDRLLTISLLDKMKSSHNNPIDFLGSIAPALFSYAAYNDIPLFKWPTILLHYFRFNGPLYKRAIENYAMANDERERKIFDTKWKYFISVFEMYTKNRLRSSGKVDVSKYADTPEKRDDFNKQWITRIPNVGFENDTPGIYFSDVSTHSSLSDAIIGFDTLVLTLRSVLPNKNLNTSKPSELKSGVESFISISKNSLAKQLPYTEFVRRTLGQGSNSKSAVAMASYYLGAILGELALPSEFGMNISGLQVDDPIEVGLNPVQKRRLGWRKLRGTTGTRLDDESSFMA